MAVKANHPPDFESTAGRRTGTGGRTRELWRSTGGFAMNTPMNELHRDIPPIKDLPPTELEQPDPQLSLSSGRATAMQIALTAVASLFILGLMIYGLNRPLNEPSQ